jgi:hypothetical protein
MGILVEVDASKSLPEVMESIIQGLKW